MLTHVSRAELGARIYVCVRARRSRVFGAGNNMFAVYIAGI